MLDYIVINVPISPIEANYFTTKSLFNKLEQTPSGRKTTELKEYGILEVNIWFNLVKMISEPLIDSYCAINATIDAIAIDKYGLEYLLNKITSKFPKTAKIYDFKQISDLKWKIKSATFTFNFTGQEIDTYYKFLRGGYDLKKSKLTKTVSQTINQGISVELTEYSGIHKGESSKYYESLV